MKNRLMILTFVGTVVFAQSQSQPAPAAAEGPGVSQGGSDETPQANAPGPGGRAPQGRRFAGPGEPGGPGGPGERFASGGRGPMSGQMNGPRPGRGGPGMWQEEGGPEMAGGPGFGGAPEFVLDQGPEGGPMDDPEDGDTDGDEELAEGPEFGAAPGFDRGPGAFGPRHGGEALGAMGLRPGGPPPVAALQEVLGLDDKQVRSLSQLRREKDRKLDQARFQLRQKQGALMDLLEQEEPDGNALVGAVKEIHSLRKQAGDVEKEFQARTSAVLNEEQKSRLKSILEARQIPRAMQEAARFDLVRPMDGERGGPVPQE